MESILNSIKKLLGISPEDNSFDVDVIIHINRALSRLNQLGVGPKEGFKIEDELSIWEEFIGENPKLNDVITYVYLKVKMVFDPSLSASVLAANKEEIAELEWTLNCTAELMPEEIEEV